jgi:hypothetical protein
LTNDVPQNVTVTNGDPSISQAQANAYGQALMMTLEWLRWSSVADAPQVTTTIGQAGGALAPDYQNEVAGNVNELDGIHGSSVWPQQITLIPLNSASQAIMDNTSDNFALVVSYPQDSYSLTQIISGKSQVTSVTPNSPAIYTGAIATNPVLGSYFQVDIYTPNCSSASAAGLCQSAGAS